MTNRLSIDCNEGATVCKNNETYCIDNKHPIPGKAILKTDYGSLGLTTLDFTNISTISLNQVIASTTIDTSCMRSLKLLIDFSGILDITSNNIDTFTFNFALIRMCKNNRVSQTLTTFTFNFAYTSTASNPASRTLKLEYSPCDDLCEACCIYAIELTNVQSASGTILNFNIKNGVISILGVDSKKSNCFSDMNNNDSGNTLLNVNSNISYSRNITFTSPNFLVTLNQPIASVYMDTTLMKKPKLLLDFTGILNVVRVDTPVKASLFFTLFKLCKDSKVRKALTTFAFNPANFSVFPNSEILKFEYSPCDMDCVDCCAYILELTSVANINEGNVSISINNGIFSVLAFDLCLDKGNKLCGNSILSSNTSSLFPGIITLATGQLTQFLNLPIVSTTIDTSYFSNPKLLIDFSGILDVFPTLGTTVTYNFTLYRTCKNSSILEPIATFAYNYILVFTQDEGNTLKFEYSPCDNTCGDCCTYTLELTSVTALAPNTIGSSISNAVLSIIAVENCCRQNI